MTGNNGVYINKHLENKSSKSNLVTFDEIGKSYLQDQIGQKGFCWENIDPHACISCGNAIHNFFGSKGFEFEGGK